MIYFYSSPQLYVPPGDLYTSFEKIILPFDIETWICILITFLLAFLLNLIIYLPIIQIWLSYRTAAQSSTLNIFRIIFGIGQTKLPEKNFSRIILISFLLWCLVIRTAYQGKLFEFTTSAIRKPEMKTLKEVEERNIILYVPDDSSEKMLDYVSSVIK